MLKLIAAVGFLSVFVLTGCDMEPVATGPVQTDHRSIGRDKSELVRADLRMGAGELHVRGGAQELMEGDFRYNVAEWKPELRYNNTGFRGILTLEQPHTAKMSHDTTNYWNVKFNNDTPVDLTVQLGAGEVTLDLGSLALRSVEVNIGAGEMKMDLRGTPKHDYDVRVRGGVGEATIHLPQGVGVMAEVHGGLGGINVHGMRKRGSQYVNDSYNDAKVRVQLDVKGGIGAINLYAN